jgi:hypothetical protein
MADRSRRLREAGVVVGLYVVAAILGVVGNGSTALIVIALFLGGVAGVLAIVFVFYEIGLGEDRDRARGRI